MSDLSIKVTIAGRIYPMKVGADEENKVRDAAKNVDANLKYLQENFAVKDKQDLLAMTALQMAIKAEESDAASADSNVDSAELKALEDMIDKML